jgi:hypothetical protein
VTLSRCWKEPEPRIQSPTTFSSSFLTVLEHGCCQWNSCWCSSFCFKTTKSHWNQLWELLRFYCGHFRGALSHFHLIFCSFFLQKGLAECIANEDGERQIACAISYHGEEIVCEAVLLCYLTIYACSVHWQSSKTAIGKECEEYNSWIQEPLGKEVCDLIYFSYASFDILNQIH